MKPLDEFAALKALDPATRDPDPHSPRAQATLERILATDPSYGVRPRRRRRILVRAAVATAAVGIVAAAVLVPRDSGPLPTGEAYAGWSAQPVGLTGEARATAVAQCRKSLKGMGTDDLINHLGTALAERRGDWALVILVGQDEASANCMTRVGPGQGGGYGYVGGPGDAPVAARQLRVTSLGTSGGGNVSYLTSAIGRAGSDITGLTYTSPTRGVVKATVSNGFFAFWIPGSEFDGLQPVPVRVTYRDGKTVATTLKLG
jgi:hypothetical protein